MSHPSRQEPLPSQEFFESLIAKDIPHDPMVVVRFTASWCQPCKRIDVQRLLDLHPGIRWFVADIDEGDNTYTLGYAGLQKIPGFMAIKNGKPQTALQCSDTEKILQWLRTIFEL